MGANAWTAEEVAWLAEVYPRHHNAEIARMHAERFPDHPRSDRAICTRARLLGLRKPDGFVRNPPRIWTPERDAWFRAFVPGHTEREIAAEHERIWGWPLSESQIANRKSALGVRSGTHGGQFAKGHVPANKGRPWDEWMPEESRDGCRRTQFKPGNVSPNQRERLDERWMNGCWQVKVDCRDAKNPMGYWVSRAHFEWERANGRPWPEGHIAIHVDRDPHNDDPANVIPVPSDIYPLVMGAVPNQMEWHDRETLRTAMLYARVTRARVDAARKGRIAAGRPRKDDIRPDDGEVG